MNGLQDIERGLRDHRKTLESELKRVDRALTALGAELPTATAEPAKPAAKKPARKPARKPTAKAAKGTKPTKKESQAKAEARKAKVAQKVSGRTHARKPASRESAHAAGNGHSKVLTGPRPDDYHEVLTGPTPDEHRPSPRGVFDTTTEVEGPPTAVATYPLTEQSEQSTLEPSEERTALVREALQRHTGPVRASLVAAATGLSRDQALAELKALEEQGEVRRSGNRRSTRWQLAQRHLEAVGSPA